MTFNTAIAWALSALLAVPLFTVVAKADDWNKKTVVTFNEPVEIPGRVLAAGEYVMKLADPSMSRDITQFYNKDESRLVATVIAVPDYRLVPPSETVITFEERASHSPEALKSWFYPGDNYGYDFVYPRTEKMPATQQVAQRTALAPPRMPAAPAPAPVKKEEPVAMAMNRPEPAPAPVEAAPEPAPAPAPAESPAPIPELPHTASNLPLLALLCIAAPSLAMGSRLRRLRTRA
jgi:hypothetical protein